MLDNNLAMVVDEGILVHLNPCRSVSRHMLVDFYPRGSTMISSACNFPTVDVPGFTVYLTCPLRHQDVFSGCSEISWIKLVDNLITEWG